MKLDIMKAQFNQGDVLKATGLSATTLQTWANRKIIEPADVNPGTGARRLYTARNAVWFGLMRDLTQKMHLPVSDAVEIIQAIDGRLGPSRLYEFANGKHDVPFFVVIWTDAAGRYESAQAASMPEASKRAVESGQPFVGLEVGRRVLEIFGVLKAVLAERGAAS